MPYEEHLNDIYLVSQNDSKYLPNHTTPNSMRHVLETICRFENPKMKLEAFIKKYPKLNECSYIYSLVQDGSHGIIRKQNNILQEDVIRGCQTIIEFLKENYEGQIEHIKH